MCWVFTVVPDLWRTTRAGASNAEVPSGMVRIETTKRIAKFRPRHDLLFVATVMESEIDAATRSASPGSGMPRRLAERGTAVDCLRVGWRALLRTLPERLDQRDTVVGVTLLELQGGPQSSVSFESASGPSTGIKSRANVGPLLKRSHRHRP